MQLSVRLALRARSAWPALAAVALACSHAAEARAHLVTSGAGPFYDGVTHFFVTPEDLLVVLALACYGGLAGKATARAVVLALPIAWLCGSAVGARLAAPLGIATGAVSWTMLGAGLLLGMNPRLPCAATTALAVALGALHGAVNGSAIAATNTSSLAAAGIVAAAGLIALLAGAASVAAAAAWQRVALRTVGSWIAAIGLMTLAWQFRPPK
jgi:hydrogenase/urease accessory protein HupE